MMYAASEPVNHDADLHPSFPTHQLFTKVQGSSALAVRKNEPQLWVTLWKKTVTHHRCPGWAVTHIGDVFLFIRY